ncbi:Uncharacterised protein [Serratia marcescens]|nr:hypothetical protein [Serratia marcescens]CVC18441.1 Uncharacterised protein [Serratia marcescens]CVD97356.1 Uncharacterised protein [Serratia marcescens]CVF04273.1 Uncharacterised protein [Serratia marcescens]CVH15673.1 Uncharacterised protein [Serratia marcescens]CVH27874.1 Uncharacterised protein [Serratia marcescens]
MINRNVNTVVVDAMRVAPTVQAVRLTFFARLVKTLCQKGHPL